MVTDVSTREVAVVLAWAGRHAARGIVAGATRRLARGARRVPREGRHATSAVTGASAEEDVEDVDRRDPLEIDAGAHGSRTSTRRRTPTRTRR